jgi:hypothetical protein
MTLSTKLFGEEGDLQLPKGEGHLTISLGKIFNQVARRRKGLGSLNKVA